MQSFEIGIHNTIITSPDRRGDIVTGVVLSKGPKKCSVMDEQGRNWKVPYELIIACSTEKAEVKVLKAKAKDVVLDGSGEKFRVDKVNQTRYTVTRIRDGAPFYLPFTSVREVLDSKTSQREWLLSKGISEADVNIFEKLFA